LISAGKVSWNFELALHEIPLKVARSPGGPTRDGKRTLPSGGSSVRETLYDKAGNKASVFELQTGTPSKKTLFSGYDGYETASPRVFFLGCG
jgi:hypothetical protein